MGENSKIMITKEQRQEMISAIKRYFLKERDEDLGDLASGFILDFFMEELAPEFYNQGVCDAHRFMSNRLEDLMAIQKI